MTSKPVVLVTGAARRLGREIALHLAGAGFEVAVHYRKSGDDAAATVTAAQALGATSSSAFGADLTDEDACRALVPNVIKHLGRLDAVVNSASIFEYDSIATFSVRAMEAHWRANTAPAIILAQALHGCLPEGRTGCVVNLLDQKLWNPNPDYFSYTLSKSALETATTLLALGLAPKVRVCGVAPGVTLPSGPMSPADFTRAHSKTVLGRSSEPIDIARAVRYLLESVAVTGTTLLVDGGQHLNKSARDVMFLTSAQPKE